MPKYKNNGTSEKWDSRQNTLGGSRDRRPEIHVISRTWDLRPVTLRVELETRDHEIIHVLYALTCLYWANVFDTCR